MGGTRGTCLPLETYTLVAPPLQIAIPQYVRTRSRTRLMINHVPTWTMYLRMYIYATALLLPWLWYYDDYRVHWLCMLIHARDASL